MARYSDKHGIFRVNHPNREGERIQFAGALRMPDIEPIQVHTPQAKGRAERADPTLQDCLMGNALPTTKTTMRYAHS